MTLRRILSALLALVMVFGASAFAETTMTSTYTMNAYSLTIARHSNVMIGRSDMNSAYTLYAPDGTALTSELYHTMDACGTMFKVGVDSGLNIYGLIDDTGAVVVPMQYGDVKCISDRWTMGVSLAPATADNYDYKAWDGSAFYLITGYDVYFDGAKVGTLARTAYKNAYAYGAFLYIIDEQGNYTYFNGTMTPSGYASDFVSSSEYEEKNHQVWHRGSNQQAFVAGCTLTSDDVELDIYEVDGRMVDLQGNVIFAIDAKYEYVDKFKGDYARVKMNGKYGLIDRTGREVLACEYDNIPYGDTFFEGDYQPAIKDGKFGYVNKNGEVTCDFVYAESAIRANYRMPATTVTDLTGNQIILSGAVGELPEKYAEVYVNTYNGSPLITVENAASQAGVIDLYGNVVIELDGKYDDVYDLSVSQDGTLVVGYCSNRTYQVYNFTHGEAAPTNVAVEKPLEEAVEAANENAIGRVTERPATETAPETAPEQPAAENADPAAWTCTCGSVNSGKFCPECGTAKPAGCPSCGVATAEGAKFCSECGASLTPAA